MNPFYYQLFWWVLGIVGTIGASLTFAAALAVIKASRKVLVHDVKIDNILSNQAESVKRHERYQQEVIDANNNIITLFTSEMEPIRENIDKINDKINTHAEKIVRIETHLKFKK